MMRTINILLIAGMLAGAGVVYHLKYEAERATTRVAQLNRKIEHEREAIANLRAEWSIYNQPHRLQKLTEHYHTYLELEPLDPNQVGTIDEIPFRARPPVEGATSRIAGVKPIGVTGTVKKIQKPAEPKTYDPKPNDPLAKIIR